MLSAAQIDLRPLQALASGIQQATLAAVGRQKSSLVGRVFPGPALPLPKHCGRQQSAVVIHAVVPSLGPLWDGTGRARARSGAHGPIQEWFRKQLGSDGG